MKLFSNRRAQETGPIQRIFFSLFLVIGLSIAMFNFIGQGVIANYDTPTLDNESAFTAYSDYSDNLTSNIDDVRNSITSPDEGALSKIDAVVTGGFSALSDLIVGPIVVADAIFRTALIENLGVPSNLVNLAYLALLSIIVFAVIALVMKVRA